MEQDCITSLRSVTATPTVTPARLSSLVLRGKSITVGVLFKSHGKDKVAFAKKFQVQGKWISNTVTQESNVFLEFQ